MNSSNEYNYYGNVKLKNFFKILIITSILITIIIIVVSEFLIPEVYSVKLTSN